VNTFWPGSYIETLRKGALDTSPRVITTETPPRALTRMVPTQLYGFHGVLNLRECERDFPCDIEDGLNAFLSLISLSMGALLQLVF